MRDKDSDLIFEKYSSLNEDVGLGHGTPKMVRMTSIGRASDEEDKKPGEDTEVVHIQAGNKEEGCSCGSDCDCGCQDNTEEGDYDGELDMARAELLKAADYATKLFNHIEKIDNLEGWTASKITKAADYLSSVFHYLEYEALNANVEDDEC